ncbi:MAG: Dinitrogenase iron-molybdenum cofactor [candidate division WS2 bacterium ADurb.Bin280]|uniref:Dinitrogenase iron-molybdenum cofactor n=1 Tax=candidate division WS2 bacterium ADurb.Bin280 TaxID=1852829 RepID=A0A1V5SD14_9BACT|nr:MAG: Dinitrogenase iron-molybdenum cofactor [candidate division WS2 bacterium ADurb.Bin280]
MKIAIACDEKNLDSTISKLGGRSPFYQIFDNGEFVETVKNPFATGAGGAGYSVAYMMADMGIDLIVAGKIGENMASALQERGIKWEEIDENMKISELVKKFSEN